ncbi:variable surface protein Vir6, putative [Plasmodium vivax]|uniref:Variable surface protein Vir6, putative n=1 Tax=Plasmodium vivax (strain Salvador I) TaxID=126793 RepID=A5KDA7_PLAVS|nr:variable surface protein Vir6, putative [Plasmodium vivax]EDL42662.1 variable surface protein Vir6, putative [Plasmodium vivax]|eukprot:XP_001612455.1 variable surface protein Vir6 [Plasmodium vivax Sal-1]
MSKPCKENFKEYPNYECYNDIKYQFGNKLRDYNYSIIESVRNYERDHAADVVQKHNVLSDVFTNVKKYLSNGHVFTSGEYDGPGTCKYISYLLYDGIRNIYGACDKDTFQIFKDFVDGYNNITRSTMCKNELKYLDDHEFKRMKDLYHLYDKYNELLPKLPFWYKEYCEDVVYLIGLYNTFLRDYESNSKEFNKVLTKIGELNNTVKKEGGKNCRRTYYIGNPRLFEPEEEKIQPPARTPLASESNLLQGGPLDSAVKTEPPKLTSSSPMLGGERLREHLENLQSSQVLNTLEVAAASESREFVGKRPPHHNLGHSEQLESFTPKETYESRRNYGPQGPYEQERYSDENETFLQGKDYFVVKEQLGLGSEKEHEGVITNMKNAFSGFMNSVDPVPVVGVSGGMGALFLLFRYTPVGAFFRGGRGRARRIPNGFIGHLAGGFPDINEYDTGYVGYGPMNIPYGAE